MGQLRVLVALRWRMVRSPRARGGLLLLLGLFVLLLVEASVAGQAVPPGSRLFDVLLLAPTLFLVFAGLALVAPLVAGGGNLLYPDEQLVAFPIRPASVYSGSLLLAPLNLAWAAQLVLLTGVIAAVSERGPGVLLALITTWSYAALVTTAGQSLAWYVIGVRHSRRGRAITLALGGALGTAGCLVWFTGHGTDLLDASPTTQVVIGALQGAAGDLSAWTLVTATLWLLTAFAYVLGVRACAWTLRRHIHRGTPESTPVLRRGARRTALRELMALDRASVWRSTPLRRGVLVLAVLPGGVAMLADPTWTGLALLPGLVAAGAGLLFGVNAFCLDGSGATWIASQPHPPTATLLAKVVVIGQTCLAAVLLAVLLAATQVDSAPTPGEATALVGSVLGSTLVVVALCARMSVLQPHKADLRGPRDTPAPPAAMAVYSLRLALTTTWVGLLFVAAAASGSPAVAAAAWVLVTALGAHSLLRTFQVWEDELRRSHVVVTVSYG